jgi:imidazolonepropionase-like amidohydrolase
MNSYALIADRVWDGSADQPQTNQAVVVEGSTISQVCDAGAVPANVERVVWPGCTILPGLIDAHVHYSAVMGPAFLAAGVTTVRDVGNDLDWIIAQRALNAASPDLGPRILCCGYLLDGPVPIWPIIGRPHADEAELRATIRCEAARGVDAIKLYAGLGVDMLRAGVDEAHRNGKHALAHLVNTTAEEAAAAGLDELEHLAGCGAAWRASSPEELERLIDVLLQHHVTVTPTLVVWDRLGRVLDLSFHFDARREWVHPCHLQIWQAWARSQSDDRMTWQNAMPHLKRALARMHARGLRVGLGTDTPFPHLFPGFSVHDELAMYVDAGIAPVDALRSATAVNADVVGLDGRAGQIAAGMPADLVVVGGDPLAHIEDIANIACTVRAGQRMAPATLLAHARRYQDRAPDDPITRDLLRRTGTTC